MWLEAQWNNLSNTENARLIPLAWCLDSRAEKKKKTKKSTSWNIYGASALTYRNSLETFCEGLRALKILASLGRVGAIQDAPVQVLLQILLPLPCWNPTESFTLVTCRKRARHADWISHLTRQVACAVLRIRRQPCSSRLGLMARKFR